MSDSKQDERPPEEASSVASPGSSMVSSARRPKPPTMKQRGRKSKETKDEWGSNSLTKKEQDLNRVMKWIAVSAFVFMSVFGIILYRLVEYDFSHAFATGFIQHKIAYKNDDYSRAVMHYNGYSDHGVNHSLALKHFAKAAAVGDTKAYTALALMLFKGEGVTQDMKTAMRWFEKASEAGEVKAMSMLCFMHYKGHIDKTMDFLTAAKWCRKAANAGDPKAQFNLGVMAAHGQGLEQDFIAAYQWLTLAMRSLPEEALNARNALVTKMTHEDVERGQDAANEWRLTHRKARFIEFPDLASSYGSLFGSTTASAESIGLDSSTAADTKVSTLSGVNY